MFAIQFSLIMTTIVQLRSASSACSLRNVLLYTKDSTDDEIRFEQIQNVVFIPRLAATDLRAHRMLALSYQLIDVCYFHRSASLAVLFQNFAPPHHTALCMTVEMWRCDFFTKQNSRFERRN